MNRRESNTCCIICAKTFIILQGALLIGQKEGTFKKFLKFWPAKWKNLVQPSLAYFNSCSLFLKVVGMVSVSDTKCRIACLFKRFVYTSFDASFIRRICLEKCD